MQLLNCINITINQGQLVKFRKPTAVHVVEFGRGTKSATRICLRLFVHAYLLRAWFDPVPGGLRNKSMTCDGQPRRIQRVLEHPEFVVIQFAAQEKAFFVLLDFAAA